MCKFLMQHNIRVLFLGINISFHNLRFVRPKREFIDEIMLQAVLPKLINLES